MVALFDGRGDVLFFLFGDDAQIPIGIGILRIELQRLATKPLGALVGFAHLLAGELGLELGEPVAELLHVREEEDGEVEDVAPLLDAPGEAADVGLELPGHTVDVVCVPLSGLGKLLCGRQQLLGDGEGVLKTEV